MQGDQNQTEEEKDKAVDQAQLDAEERERNPKVKQLVDQAMELMNPKESEDGHEREFCHHKRDVRRIPRFVQQSARYGTGVLSVTLSSGHRVFASR